MYFIYIYIYIYICMKAIIVIISKNKSKNSHEQNVLKMQFYIIMLYKFHQDRWTNMWRHGTRSRHYRKFHRKRSSLYKINHEGWNIIQEHNVLWLDAVIVSKHPNNTQYMHIYIYICIYIYIYIYTHICLSCKMRFWTFKRIEVKNYQC